MSMWKSKLKYIQQWMMNTLTYKCVHMWIVPGPKPKQNPLQFYQ